MTKRKRNSFVTPAPGFDPPAPACSPPAPIHAAPVLVDQGSAPVDSAAASMRVHSQRFPNPPVPIPVNQRHGPQSRPEHPYGTARLRAVLNLTGSVSTQELCEDAAQVIEELRVELAARPPAERRRSFGFHFRNL